MLAAFARSAHDMLGPDTTAPRRSTASAGYSCSVSAAIVVGAAAMLIVRTRFPPTTSTAVAKSRHPPVTVTEA